MKIYLAAHHASVIALHSRYGSDRIGCCIQPGKWGDPKIPYFIDNGAFTDWRHGREFQADKFLELLENAARHGRRSGNWPDFVVCPDRYADPSATLKLWPTWSDRIRSLGFEKVAFVAQPGHEPSQTPGDCDLIFTGGGKPWKFEQIKVYRNRFPVHVGGVTASKLYFCHVAGAASGDSAGFFRGDMRQLQRLYSYLADAAGELESMQAPSPTRCRKKRPTEGQLCLFS